MFTVKHVSDGNVVYHQCVQIIYTSEKVDDTDPGVLLWLDKDHTRSCHFSYGTAFVMNEHGKTIDVIRL